jgi:hypothetical protein
MSDLDFQVKSDSVLLVLQASQGSLQAVRKLQTNLAETVGEFVAATHADTAVDAPSPDAPE